MLGAARSGRSAALARASQRSSGLLAAWMSTMRRTLHGKKVMAANRGEIALRIMRAATELGANTVGAELRCQIPDM